MDAFDRTVNIRKRLAEQIVVVDLEYFPLSYTFWRLTRLVFFNMISALRGRTLLSGLSATRSFGLPTCFVQTRS